MTVQQFGDNVRQHLHTKPDNFLWKQGFLLFGRVMIDVEYLEAWLEQNPSYDPEESIKDNIVNLYGNDAAKFVESVL